MILLTLVSNKCLTELSKIKLKNVSMLKLSVCQKKWEDLDKINEKFESIRKKQQPRLRGQNHREKGRC